MKKQKFKCLIAGLILLISFQVNAQNKSSLKGQSSIGLGFGITYGGIGAQFNYNPADQLSIFGGLGYLFADVGYNFGAKYVFNSDSQTEFYLTGMYGTNAALIIQGSSELNKVYLGPSFGLGVKVNSRKTEGNYWDIALIVPARGSEYNNDLNALKSNGLLIQEPWPIIFAVGYNFAIN